MNIKEIADTQSFKQGLENIARTVVFDMLMPYADEYVKKTSNKWDDTALLIAKDFLKDVIDNIAKDEPEQK